MFVGDGQAVFVRGRPFFARYSGDMPGRRTGLAGRESWPPVAGCSFPPSLPQGQILRYTILGARISTHDR
jgi:hypothetical protein